MTDRAFDNCSAQRAFRDRMQDLLRAGKAESALISAREELALVIDADPELARLATAIEPRDIELVGWHDLAARLGAFDQHKKPITALGIDFSYSGHNGAKPDDKGALEPYIETSYYADQPDLAFSTADTDTILQGYSAYGSKWQGCFEDIDNLIEVKGLEQLYGAVALRDMKRDHDSSEGDIHTIAACICAILVHLAVKQAVLEDGLPYPIAVLVGSNEDFPFFDAPVFSLPQAAQILTPTQREPEPELPAEAEPEWSEPEERPMPSGASLRQRYVDASQIVIEPAPKRGWLRERFGF